MNQKLRKTVAEQLVRTFGPGEPLILGRAPGRVNLIGEHTDYNDGFVFPMALDFEIVVAGRRRADRTVRLLAVDLREKVEFSLAEPIVFDEHFGWSNYLRGVLKLLQQSGAELPGMELAFAGDVPLGSGLSSSAALEVATAIVVQRMTGFGIERPALAKLCQRAENEFVGMNCGIMDQFISMMGEQDHALFLDCRSLEYRQIPLELGAYRIVVCHSGVKHSLVESEYNRRRQECEAGVRVLAAHFPEIKALRDARPEQLVACQNELDPVVYRRCRHVISEDARVLESIQALNHGDLVRFGQMMNESHDSLRDLYEVSCSEIDLLVELARQVPGVLGARITGGGFGGCTVNLVAEEAVDRFTERICRLYREKTGIDARIFISKAADGAQIIE
ncbi:galactokinase [Hydrogenispora ethanolica]|uniref:Galactokinase n=1 Tax=Hydrogenispora ethanolica TaxID=1082276 RepID=A0A4R1R7Y7_HYDET|nr:galactokinase [Hydrogenispora ethanolica]TCL61452.1 galactokinase [Hydrogenispora ethanolica]